MSRFTSASRTAFAAAFFLTLLFRAGPIFSQEQDIPGAPFITKVSVRLKDQADDQSLRGLIPLRDGDVFSLKDVTEAVRKVYQTGLFSDVEVLREGEQNVILTFVLERRLYTRRIVFSGLDDISVRGLKAGMYAVREGQPFEQGNMQRAETELKEILAEEGYFQAVVTGGYREEPAASRVDVTFQVDMNSRYVVNSIEFSGDVIVSEPDLRKKMDIKVGKSFVPAELDADIERLKNYYHSLDYQQVEISVRDRIFDDLRQRVNLVLEVIPRDKIVIEIQGAETPLDLISPLWEARIFEEWGLDEGEAKILNWLRRKGFLFASVRSRVEREDNVLRVIHTVSKGKRFRIENVQFRGVTHFSPEEIKKELNIRESIPLLGRSDGAKLFELPFEIQELYKTKGFPDAAAELVFERDGERVKPIFIVSEGRQEIIKNIVFEGWTLFSPEQMSGQIQSRPEGPFFQPLVQKDIERLQTFYLNHGIRGTEISAQVNRKEEDFFDVTFQIREGAEVRIEEVIITGNKVTRRAVIQREILVDPGEKARYDLIRLTKRNLEGLGIFTEVKIEEIPLSEGRINLLISVREGELNYASLGLGLETKEGPRSFDIWNDVLRLRGTAEYIRNNIFGSAIQLSLVGQLSPREQRAVVALEQPYFFGIPLETVLNAWVEREERVSYSFDRRGISLSTARFLNPEADMVLLGTLRVARTTLFDLYLPESEVDRQFFPYSTTSLAGSFVWDKRNDPFNPERGHFFSSSLEWAYPLFNTESNYLKLFAKHQHYFSLYPRVTLAVTGRIGLGRGKMPIHERFFGGGSNTFRGEEYDELGPNDPDSGKPVGGKALMLVNLELTFPILKNFPNVYGVIFYDKGNIFAKRSTVSWKGLKDAAGLGLRYKTPLGPVRLEVGWPMDGGINLRRAMFYVTIGNIF
jgi:outer membrane protein insertion porin family